MILQITPHPFSQEKAWLGYNLIFLYKRKYHETTYGYGYGV